MMCHCLIFENENFSKEKYFVCFYFHYIYDYSLGWNFNFSLIARLVRLLLRDNFSYRRRDIDLLTAHNEDGMGAENLFMNMNEI